MTKAQKAEKDTAIAQLREWLKPGDTVYTILQHVSRSGMQREIRCVIPYAEKTFPNFDQPSGRCAVECECTFGRGDHGAFLAAHDPTVRVDFLHPNWAISKALGNRQGKSDGIIMGGCGMDMGFALVYELSHVLFGHGYACLGKGNGTVGGRRCPSSYHSNHHDTITCPGTLISTPDGDTGERCHWVRGIGYVIGDEDTLTQATCPICKGEGRIANPDGPERWDLTHQDGYALRHQWL